MRRNGDFFVQFGNGYGIHVLAIRVHRERRPIVLVVLSFLASSGVQVVVALAAEGQLGHHLAVNHLQLGVDDLEHGSTALGGHLIIAVLDLPAGFAGIGGIHIADLLQAGRQECNGTVIPFIVFLTVRRNGDFFVQFGNGYGVDILALRILRERRPIVLIVLSLRAGAGVQVVVAGAAEGQLCRHLAVNHLQLGVDDLEHGSTALGGHLIVAVLDLPAGFAGIGGIGGIGGVNRNIGGTGELGQTVGQDQIILSSQPAIGGCVPLGRMAGEGDARAQSALGQGNRVNLPGCLSRVILERHRSRIAGSFIVRS